MIYFLDQDAARQALVKAYSPSAPRVQIISDVFVEISAVDLSPWFSRVPTASNPADPASRMDFKAVTSTFVKARLSKAVYQRS